MNKKALWLFIILVLGSASLMYGWRYVGYGPYAGYGPYGPYGYGPGFGIGFGVGPGWYDPYPYRYYGRPVVYRRPGYRRVSPRTRRVSDGRTQRINRSR